MNARGMVTALGIFVSAASITIAADQKELAGRSDPDRQHTIKESGEPSEKMSLLELASLIDRVVTERYGETGADTFTREHLKLLWEHFSHQPNVSAKTAKEVASLWASERSGADKQADRSRLNEEALSRIWQTYHCILADHQPLSENEVVQKKKQIHRLAVVLDELDDELLKRHAEIPQELLDGIRGELRRSVAHLKEYADSPAYPLLYYPLSDGDFEKVMERVRADFEKRIDDFLTNLPQTISWARARSDVKDKKSRAFLSRTSFEQKGNTFAAIAMGNILRQYCMLGRKMDYNSRMFPTFLKANGVGVSYALGGGLSMRISSRSAEM